MSRKEVLHEIHKEQDGPSLQWVPGGGGYYVADPGSYVGWTGRRKSGYHYRIRPAWITGRWIVEYTPPYIKKKFERFENAKAWAEWHYKWRHRMRHVPNGRVAEWTNKYREMGLLA